MKLPLSELLDRWSIELRKDYYGHGNRQLLDAVAAEIREWLCDGHRQQLELGEIQSIVKAGVLLGIRNSDIANSEWQIRTKQNLPLEEIGRRAKLTRTLNDSRSEIKQELSKELRENVETRHFGFGGLESERMTLGVQEPPTAMDGVFLKAVPSVDPTRPWGDDKLRKGRGV